MTPEEALDFYTDMTQAEIDRLLSGAFDITQFNLAEDNLGVLSNYDRSRVYGYSLQL